jgi:cytochrome P450
MSEKQLLDEIVILFIAGHETTGNALTWALYLLATHPGEYAALREATASLPFADAITHPKLLAVINESMRLYPPAWVSDRVAVEDDSFNGFSYPAGTIIALFYYGLHRSPKYWDDPLAFKPERFLGERERSRIFFPFGGGPRLCIGNNFALAEMALFLKTFAQVFDLKATGILPRPRALVTLRPEGVRLNVQKR